MTIDQVIKIESILKDTIDFKNGYLDFERKPDQLTVFNTAKIAGNSFLSMNISHIVTPLVFVKGTYVCYDKARDKCTLMIY